MSLSHRINKYLDDKGKPAADFTGPIQLRHDKEKDTAGKAIPKDGNGDYIFAWDVSTYGRKPTFSQLPADGVSLTHAKAKRNEGKLNRAEFMAVDNIPDLLALLEPRLDQLNMFEGE